MLYLLFLSVLKRAVQNLRRGLLPDTHRRELKMLMLPDNRNDHYAPKS
jgi:hypothetical protein